MSFLRHFEGDWILELAVACFLTDRRSDVRKIAVAKVKKHVGPAAAKGVPDVRKLIRQHKVCDESQTGARA